MTNNNFFIHASAIVDEGARIGDGTKVWHFSHIMAKAVIGKHCSIGQNVFVADEVTLGDKVKVQNNVSLYTGVLCEDEVFIGPSAVFTNVINPRSAVERKAEYRNTLLKKGATIGANATIVCGVTIGCYAFIGAGSVVTKNVADYALMAGNPAQQIGWMSQHGEKLVFDAQGKAICKATGSVYQITQNIVEKLSV